LDQARFDKQGKHESEIFPELDPQVITKAKAPIAQNVVETYA